MFLFPQLFISGGLFIVGVILVTLGLEPRAVYMLRKGSTTKLHLNPLVSFQSILAISVNFTELIKQSHLFDGTYMRHTDHFYLGQCSSVKAQVWTLHICIVGQD